MFFRLCSHVFLFFTLGWKVQEIKYWSKLFLVCFTLGHSQTWILLYTDTYNVLLIDNGLKLARHQHVHPSIIQDWFPIDKPATAKQTIPMARFQKNFLFHERVQVTSKFQVAKLQLIFFIHQQQLSGLQLINPSVNLNPFLLNYINFYPRCRTWSS